jgi:hypothetical protein
LQPFQLKIILVLHPILVDLAVIATTGTLYLGHRVTRDIRGSMGFENRLRVKGLELSSEIGKALCATV